MSSSSSESVHVRVMVRVRPFNKREIAIHQQQQQANARNSPPPPLTSPSNEAAANNNNKLSTNNSNSLLSRESTSGRESPGVGLSQNNSFARSATPPLLATNPSFTTSSGAMMMIGNSAASDATSSQQQQSHQNLYPPSVVCVGDRETIHLLEPERDWAEREAFRFDKVFWSVPNEQTIPPPGASSALFSPPAKPHSQQDVFDEVGAPSLQATLEGRNTCLFAYGQTGAGKSYSMLGSETDEGVAPLFVRALFDEVQKKRDLEPESNYEVKVELGFLEIYNEKVRDLLSIQSQQDSSSSSGGALSKTIAQQQVSEQSYANCRVRQFPGKGTFVEGLQRKTISDARECLHAINAGMSQRATAATSMNATSSRSHGIFQLVVTQRFYGVTRTAQVNLVDLAGSERIKQSQVTGAALTEATMINKSLSTLRRVIDVLIDNSNLKKGRTPTLPPYRESLLTWVLSDALGGNSRTVMIAAVSPHHANAEDTLSTLRYALKAKAIVCTAKVNEEKTSAILSSLKDEIDQLKQQLTENSSTSLAEELAARQQEMDGMAERAKRLEARHGVMEQELTRRKAEIEAAEAQLQKLDEQLETEGKDKEEVEALMKIRQDLMASEQALQNESATRQRAEEELHKATEQRKVAEELHQKTQEEISNAKKEQKEMRVRQLLSTFQSAFVRMMKGQDLDQLRQERAKCLRDLDEANRKLALSEDQLSGFEGDKEKLDKRLEEIRNKIDRTAHSDMLSENPMMDRRIVEAKRRRKEADDELKTTLESFDEVNSRLNQLKIEQQGRRGDNRVEKARLLTEIAEIDRQAKHLNTRISQHRNVVADHGAAESLYREKEGKHLEELRAVEENNSHRSSNIAALNEALARERSNQDLLENTKAKKEREYDMLRGLLEQLEKSLYETNQENENMKTKMNELFLPPTARNSLGAAAAFQRSATNASSPGTAENLNKNQNQNAAGDEEMMNENDNNNNNKFSRQNTNMSVSSRMNSGGRKSPIPWRGTSFSRTLTNVSSTFSTKEQFEVHQQNQNQEDEERLVRDENNNVVITPRQLIAGGQLRSGGVHYNPPVSPRKMKQPMATSDYSSISFSRQNSPSSSSRQQFSRQNTPVATQQRATSAGVTYRRKSATGENNTNKSSYQHQQTSSPASRRAVTPVSSANQITTNRHQRIREQLANSKPVFSSRGESLVGSGSLKVFHHRENSNTSVMVSEADREEESNDGHGSNILLSPQSSIATKNYNSSGRGAMAVRASPSPSISRPRLGRPRPAFK